MVKKVPILILTIIFIVSLLSVNVFAADDISNSDMVDAQGGFFRDIAGYIADGFNKSIDGVKNGINAISQGLKNGINAIGGFFSKTITAIGNAVKDIGKFIATAISSLLDGLKRLFIPSENYFPEIQKRLQAAINEKLGGILSFTEYLKTRFSQLSVASAADTLLVLEYPQGHILAGTRVDLLYRVRAYISMFRDVFTGVMMLLTGFYAYQQVKGMINT